MSYGICYAAHRPDAAQLCTTQHALLHNYLPITVLCCACVCVCVCVCLCVCVCDSSARHTNPAACQHSTPSCLQLQLASVSAFTFSPFAASIQPWKQHHASGNQPPSTRKTNLNPPRQDKLLHCYNMNSESPQNRRDVGTIPNTLGASVCRAVDSSQA
jgi:hypothetical protein